MGQKYFWLGITCSFAKRKYFSMKHLPFWIENNQLHLQCGEGKWAAIMFFVEGQLWKVFYLIPDSRSASNEGLSTAKPSIDHATRVAQSCWRSGWPDWAIFRLLGEYLLRQSLMKNTLHTSPNECLLISKVCINFGSKRAGLHLGDFLANSSGRPALTFTWNDSFLSSSHPTLTDKWNHSCN
jgi:hypothetical protein